jgi:hypothetical protein
MLKEDENANLVKKKITKKQVGEERNINKHFCAVKYIEL